MPGSRRLLSNLPSSALRMHVEWLSKHRDSTSILKALPGKLDIKRHSASILHGSASMAIRQAFFKPCLANLISKDTQLYSLVLMSRFDYIFSFTTNHRRSTVEIQTRRRRCYVVLSSGASITEFDIQMVIPAILK